MDLAIQPDRSSDKREFNFSDQDKDGVIEEAGS